MKHIEQAYRCCHDCGRPARTHTCAPMHYALRRHCCIQQHDTLLLTHGIFKHCCTPLIRCAWQYLPPRPHTIAACRNGIFRPPCPLSPGFCADPSLFQFIPFLTLANCRRACIAWPQRPLWRDAVTACKPPLVCVALRQSLPSLSDATSLTQQVSTRTACNL